jgi:hypothetical protein
MRCLFFVLFVVIARADCDYDDDCGYNPRVVCLRGECQCDARFTGYDCQEERKSGRLAMDLAVFVPCAGCATLAYLEFWLPAFFSSAVTLFLLAAMIRVCFWGSVEDHTVLIVATSIWLTMCLSVVLSVGMGWLNDSRGYSLF